MLMRLQSGWGPGYITPKSNIADFLIIIIMVTGDLNGKFISNIWRPRESLPISFCMTLGEGNSRFPFADSKEKAG